MKNVYKLFLPMLFLHFASCGLLDSGGGMPDVQGYSITRIYSINLDGNGLKLLTVGNNYTLLLNGKIIYLNNNKLYSCNSDGTDSTLLTPQNISINSYQVYLSGAKIILGQYPPLYIMNPDGSEFSQFNLPINIGNITYTFAWVYSPDGKQLLYTDNAGLHLMNSDGSDLRVIKDSTNRSSFYQIGFTPDGNNIIYIQDIQQGVAFDLRLYNT